MRIIKDGNNKPIEYKMVCYNCGCEAIYTKEDIHFDQRDGDYVVCPCCGRWISHNG